MLLIAVVVTLLGGLLPTALGFTKYAVSEDNIKILDVVYESGGKEYLTRAAYDTSFKGKRPLVIIFPDWDNVDDTEIWRMKQVANWGYVAVAVDVYGIQEPVGPALPVPRRFELLTELLSETEARLEMYDTLLKSVKKVVPKRVLDAEQMACFGYCLGGIMSMQVARSNELPVKAVASFHGGTLFPFAESLFMTNETTYPRIALFEGADDPPLVNFPETVTIPSAAFAQSEPYGEGVKPLPGLLDELRASGADFQASVYGLTPHSFTKPFLKTGYVLQHSEMGTQNNMFVPTSNQRSWEDLYSYLETTFKPETVEYVDADSPFESGVSGDVVVEKVAYSDGGDALTGVLAYNKKSKGPAPSVIVLPDWDGIGEYEIWRAKLLAGMGYVAFVADVYGDDVPQPVAEIPDRIVQVGLYLGDNVESTRTRVRAAIKKVKGMKKMVDGDKIGIIGYCFGGTQALEAMRDEPDGLVAVVAFHAGDLLPGDKPAKKCNSVRTLVQTGALDPVVPNDEIMALNNELQEANVMWEHIVFGNTDHAWTEPEGTRYNDQSDYASWQAMKGFLREAFLSPGGACDADLKDLRKKSLNRKPNKLIDLDWLPKTKTNYWRTVFKAE